MPGIDSLHITTSHVDLDAFHLRLSNSFEHRVTRNSTATMSQSPDKSRTRRIPT